MPVSLVLIDPDRDPLVKVFAAPPSTETLKMAVPNPPVAELIFVPLGSTLGRIRQLKVTVELPVAGAADRKNTLVAESWTTSCPARVPLLVGEFGLWLAT